MALEPTSWLGGPCCSSPGCCSLCPPRVPFGSVSCKTVPARHGGLSCPVSNGSPIENSLWLIGLIHRKMSSNHVCVLINKKLKLILICYKTINHACCTLSITGNKYFYCLLLLLLYYLYCLPGVLSTIYTVYQLLTSWFFTTFTSSVHCKSTKVIYSTVNRFCSLLCDDINTGKWRH